jgi:hypothetical protein
MPSATFDNAWSPKSRYRSHLPFRMPARCDEIHIITSGNGTAPGNYILAHRNHDTYP